MKPFRITAILGMIAIVVAAMAWYGVPPEDRAKVVGTAHSERPNFVVPVPAVVPTSAQMSANPSPPPVFGSASAVEENTRSREARQQRRDQYLGTLNDQIEKALTIKDGEMAADLAAKLLDCDVNALVMAVNGSNGGGAAADPALQAIRIARLQEYQRQFASCQTVPGNRTQVRLQLLDIAIEQKVVGSAVNGFNAGVRRPDVLQQVALDAAQGELSSLFTVAAYKSTLFGIDAAAQQSARYALKIASEDGTVGPRISNLLKNAEVFSVSLAGEKSAKFDFSNMSDTTRAEGAAIAARLIQRLTRPGA